ncbi:MAG: hypothetical protein BroJett011_45910 [Chloroflexota bacterium]|nr:MAG: hypothetical protein BroJett011_45910 [Chloroflexota bacterium]
MMGGLQELYNQRYTGDYREYLGGYEIARWAALAHFIPHIVAINTAKTVLDYGAGNGLHVALWERLFPEASLHFCDISSVARDKFRLKYPKHADTYRLVHDNQANFADNSFDTVVSVEVMEHVEDLPAYLQDIYRLLKPGGWFVWTTPCANKFSIEHVASYLTGKIEKTNEGYRRWQWEDPTHLRRLKSREIKALLEKIGYSEILFRFRAHLFSYVCTYWLPPDRFSAQKDKLMTWDYRLFRRLPNGASMLGSARKLRQQ